MNGLLQFDTVDGGQHDCLPSALTFAEAFEGEVNENFPEAKTFVVIVVGPMQHQLLVSQTFDEIVAVAGPDFLALNGANGNRVLIRKDQIAQRRTRHEDGNISGSFVTLSMFGNMREVPVTETVAEIREAVSSEQIVEEEPPEEPAQQEE